MLPAGCVIGHSEWAPTRKTDIGSFVNTVRSRSGTPQNPQEEDVPLTPTDAQTVWNNRMEVPENLKDAYNAPVYSAESMLLGANYWAAQTYKEQVAQRAALASILSAVSGPNSVTEAELNAALDRAVAEMKDVTPPAV